MMQIVKYIYIYILLIIYNLTMLLIQHKIIKKCITVLNIQYFIVIFNYV